MGNVTFRNLTKKYPGERRNSVDNFSLEVEEGEFLVLVGPSGCGKSTLLRMIAGLEDISSGEIFISDSLVNYVSSSDRNIAMVFQNYALYPQMTVYENIAFGLRMRKLPKHMIHERITSVAKILELTTLLEKIPKNLSGGQRQRVALGRAIVREPEVFLMDEPLSNLDAKLRVSMREEIMKLHKRLKTTFIYVTHDQVEAMTMGTRIVVMRNGVAQQVGTPREIYSKPTNMFVASFIGSPPINFVTGRLTIDGENKYFSTKRHTLKISSEQKFDNKYWDKPIIMGIRAESLKLAPATQENISPDESRMKGKVDFVEFMGSDAYLHVDMTDCKITIRTDVAESSFGEEEELSVLFNMKKALFFDPTTEELIP